MNGAEALMKTAVSAGVDLCLANPGTTEMPLVAALDSVPGMRAVLGLFEGVCTGAADGYARMSRKPAMTLLHLGPGFANGIANLHNARRAHSPIVTLIGDHASWHLAADAPLTSDIESLARPVSSWLSTTAGASALAGDCAAAIQASQAPPGCGATLVIPQDAQWANAPGPVAPLALDPAPDPDASVVEAVVAALRSNASAALFLGGRTLDVAGIEAAARVQAASGCRVVVETFPARHERGGALPNFERLPYFPEQGIEALATVATLVLAGTSDPVAFFGYREGGSRIAPDAAQRLTLAAKGFDGAAALNAVADALGAPASVAIPPTERPGVPDGELNAGSLGQALAALQPEGAIVVDEAATSGLAYHAFAASAPRHSLLTLTGGAIGQGLPGAVGAALACPDRRVIAFQADGSGLYTVQSLWTMARESLDIVVVVCANRAYRILRFELGRAGIAEPGHQALALTDLSQPEIQWTLLAQGLGVPAKRVETIAAFATAFERALATSGPSLIEVML